MPDMVHSRIGDPAKDRRDSSDLRFIVGAAVVAIGMIVAAYALSVSPSVDPDQVLSIFAAP